MSTGREGQSALVAWGQRGVFGPVPGFSSRAMALIPHPVQMSLGRAGLCVAANDISQQVRSDDVLLALHDHALKVRVALFV